MTSIFDASSAASFAAGRRFVHAAAFLPSAPTRNAPFVPPSSHPRRFDGGKSFSSRPFCFAQPSSPARRRSFSLSNDGESDGVVAKDGDNFLAAQDPSEMFDLYPPPPSSSLHNTIVDETWGSLHHPSPFPTGERKTRSLVHADGDWHRSVQVWIAERSLPGGDGGIDRKGGGCGGGATVRVLLQRRSPYKDTHPNLLDVSCAGHVDAGAGVVETVLRELEEELGLRCVSENEGGNGGGGGSLATYRTGESSGRQECARIDLERGRAFTAASSVEGKTERHGGFFCREYQEVFILWWNESAKGEDERSRQWLQRPSLRPDLFVPESKEEVAGFEVADGRELIRRLRDVDGTLVPRSTAYVNALEFNLGLTER